MDINNKYHFVFSGLIVIILVAVLSGCNNYKEYNYKDMKLSEEYLLPEDVDSVDLADTLIEWKDFFNDPDLVQLIDSAFQQNFNLRIVNKDIEIKNQYYKQSKLAFLPSINLNLLNVERDWNSRNSGSGPETDYYSAKNKSIPDDWFLNSASFSTTIALDWEIDIWGKFRKQKRAAAAYYQQSFEFRKALKTEMVATVAEDYYTLLMLDEQLKVAQRNYSLRDSTLKMIQLLYNSGEITASAIYQSKLQVLEAAALIPKLKRERAIQENNLSLIIGKLPDSITRGKDLFKLITDYQMVEKLPLYLVQNRPDVKIARYELKAANENVGIAQVARYPNLSISLEGGVESMLGVNWFNIPGSLLGSVVGGLTAPIFNARQLKTNYEVAKLKRDQAEISFQHNVYAAIVDIRNTMVSIQRLKERLEIAKHQEFISQKAVNSSRRLFRSGYATYLEVITSQSKALDAELNLVNTKTRLLLQYIQLYRALGGGWK